MMRGDRLSGVDPEHRGSRMMELWMFRHRKTPSDLCFADVAVAVELVCNYVLLMF